MKGERVGDSQQVKDCGICTSPGHFTNACPTLREEPIEHADAVGGFFGQQQRSDPFSNIYNPGWRNHPNLKYDNQNFQKPPPPPQSPNSAREDRTENSVERGHAQQGKSEIELKIFSKQAKKPEMVLVTKPPFPERFAKGEKEEEENEIFETFRKAPILKLKELPKHLKYAYLGENGTLPVIISSKLSTLEEEKLIRVLREFREAIG
ncbi:UNVERIFIED_CONTAM: hypothetical protein Slati_2999800 [Sesamum latifolium]|uniref:Reverse transcriptase domain-containing protein n=1 Tax=Sesamum latifolium TaxID=2727402 RepID=A0AAW2VJ11_9LAMI